MRCPKCNGLARMETIISFGEKCESFLCFICGNVWDEVIEINRELEDQWPTKHGNQENEEFPGFLEDIETLFPEGMEAIPLAM